MQPDAKWRGVFVIVTTPFNEDLSLDLPGLRRVVRFCIESGVHGVVAPANSGEQPYLSDDERLAVMRTVIEEAAGQVATVAGVTAATARLAASLAREAREMGADAVMAMPPNVQRASEAEIRACYAAIADAGLPVFVQNWNGPGATPMSAALVADLVRSIEGVRFVKEETEFASPMMTAIAEAAGPALRGIMGGKGSRHLLDEHRRGACGTMPACDVADVHAAFWNALDGGDRERAKEIHRRLLPLLMFGTGYGPTVYKEVLRRRGVIACAAVRQTGGRALDALAMQDLAELLDDLRPLMTHALPG